ncbi:MAG: type II CRISPR-associated endonuclease Cas1 [Candidatus Paceibacterota bacterium]|jgi:CRISPR-associated protein Cas1
MSWRIINVSNEARVSVRQEQLVLKQDAEYTIPLEDIGVLILESHSIIVSIALLDACVRHKVALFVCDIKHHPSGVLLGYQQHSRQVKVIENQIAWTEPFKKRVWQNIIQRKIKNQQAVLEKITGKKFPDFEMYARTVNSGDTLNREATAARAYFSALLPLGSTRNSEDKVNAVLNYGYAILRGTLARSVAAYGFMASIGVNHSSELNSFNLVDDLIEPYRPALDLLAFGEILKDSSNEEELSKDDKAKILSILTTPISLDGEQTILHAMEMTAQSLVTATEQKDPTLIRLPEIIIPL